MRKSNALFACLILALVPYVNVYAQQEEQNKEKQPQAEVEQLRKKLDEQAAQLTQLQEMIKQQQAQMDALRQKVEKDGGEAASTSQTPSASTPKSGAAPATSNESAPVSPATAATPTLAKTESKSSSSAKTAQSVEAGYGKIKFNGLLQGWYSSGDQGVADSFRIRRAELKFSGAITPKAKWTVMIDPAKVLSVNNTFATVGGQRVLTNTSVNQASRVMQEMYFTYDVHKKVRVDFGQYKIPLSYEGPQSSATIETVERALFMSDRSRGGGLGDQRDFGAMISGPIVSGVDYQIGLFNGSGETQNDLDRNDSKTLIGRLTLRPAFVKGLQFGGSGAWGGTVRHDRPKRDRMGLDLLYIRDKFMFKSEYMTGKDALISRHGYYTHFGYKFTPKIEGIFRYDAFDPDRNFETNAANVTERDYIGGINYYITENKLKFQVNYLRKTFANGITPSRNLLLVNLQTSW